MASRSSSDFPGFDGLYLLADAMERRYAYAALKAPETLERAISEPTNTTLTVYWERSAGVIADVIWTDYPLFSLIAPHVAEALERQRATGWKIVPAVCTNDPNAGERLALLPLGRCGAPDWTRGTWIQNPSAPGPWKSVLRGLYFDESTWDGTDLFSPQGTHFLLATETVVSALREFQIGNVSITRLSDVTIPELVIRSISGSVQ